MDIRPILISGKQGSGKTTLATALGEEFFRLNGFAAKQFIFAQAIYDIQNFARGYMRDLGFERPEKDGKLLQLLGTEWGRATIGQDVWVNTCKAQIKQWTDSARTGFVMIPIISDCRFRNEFDNFENALRIRLTCSESIRKERCDTWRDATTHQSEIDLDIYASEGKFDMVFNTGSVSVDTCKNLIMKQILSNNWIEKRGK